jgi:hypothetical protein
MTRAATSILMMLLVLSAVVARADDPATSLYKSLSSTTPGTMPNGFTGVDLNTIKPSDSDLQSGMIGIASLVFKGAPPPSTAEIRYAVFSQNKQARGFDVVFGQRLGGQQEFLPYLPNASCASNSQMDLCGMASGNVYVITIAHGFVTANTHEQQVIRGINAPGLLLYALKNLKQIRNNIGQAPAAPQATASVDTSGSGPCALLTASLAAAAMRSPVMPARNEMGTCFYGSQSSPGDGVSLQLIDGGRSKFDFDHNRISYTRNLNGIGDAAFEFVSAAGFIQVYVLKGNTYFAITLTNQRDRNARNDANQLAREIADAIPP